ncbi:hypothetical protein [Gimesia maris]|uniref:PD-(D/E)XK nuclease domain-containing protein n=1 Tax=Gimesia maris TaxID=122 RepID=UPI0032EBC7B8
MSNWSEDQASLCESIADLNKKYAKSSCDETSAVSPESIISALNEFQECVRYLNTRRSTGAVLNLQSEADVQDAVYLMLRPWISDLISENPTGKVANRYSIKDFISASARTVIEIKFVRDSSHGKSISKEMHDDIEVYRHHYRCRTIVFFVYDPDSLIPDHQNLKNQIEEERVYAGKPLQCILIIKP